MPLESATFVSDLTTSNPAASDAVAQGDDHLRLLKTVLQSTFPNADRALRFPAVSAKSSSFTVDADNTLWVVDASGGAVTVTLPAVASVAAGYLVAVQKDDTSNLAVTINPNGSELIAGATTYVLTAPKSAVLFQNTGTAWVVVASNDTSSPGVIPLVIARLATTGNVNLNNALENNDTLDGTTIATGDVIAVVAQTATDDNGIYIAPASGAASRHPLYNTYNSHVGLIVIVATGTARANTIWRSKANYGGTLSTTAITFTQVLTVDEFTTEETAPDFTDYVFGEDAAGNRRRFDIGSLPGNRLLHVRDEKSAGTAGGTFSSGDWRTRTLNTSKTNEITGASLASNQITLPAGTYFIDAIAPYVMGGAGLVKARLRNTTDGSDTLLSINNRGTINGGVSMIQGGLSIVRGRFTITGAKVFELQHRTDTSQFTNGFGDETDFSVTEVYADVLIWRIA